MSDRRSILLLCDESRSHAANVLQHIEALATLSAHDVYRFNPLDHPDACAALDLSEFDVIAIHYTIALTSSRYLPAPLPERIAAFGGLKVQFIQDEYRAVDAVTSVMRSLGIGVLFTCVPESAATRVYRPRLPGTITRTVLPGYVPDELVGRDVPPLAERPLDVGYRGRDVPIWLGRLGREKIEIGRRFLERAADTVSAATSPPRGRPDLRRGMEPIPLGVAQPSAPRAARRSSTSTAPRIRGKDYMARHPMRAWTRSSAT